MKISTTLQRAANTMKRLGYRRYTTGRPGRACCMLGAISDVRKLGAQYGDRTWPYTSGDTDAIAATHFLAKHIEPCSSRNAETIVFDFNDTHDGDAAIAKLYEAAAAAKAQGL